jgi:hypothetical protein
MEKVYFEWTADIHMKDSLKIIKNKGKELRLVKINR